MANHRPEVETTECDSLKTSSLACAILGKPKAVVYPGKVQFDIGFLVPGQKVNSVDQALRTLRMVPSWTSIRAEKITEMLVKIKAWKFPVPYKMHNLNELAFRYGLQHFYKYCCISGSGSKLLYDDKYFDDLMTYLSEDGYSSGMPMWLSPDLICDTLIFIQSYYDNLDESSAGKGGSSENRKKLTYALDQLKDNVEIVNYVEAKTIVTVFIKELLDIESEITDSVLQFFTNNWLNNMYRGCYQFTSREAFCMFFNNVATFEFSHHLMFYVPNIKNPFVKRLLIPRASLKLDESFGRNQRSTLPYYGYDDEPKDELTNVIGRLCGFRLAGKSHDADARAMKTLSSASSLVVRMCPDSSSDSRIPGGGQLKTIGEILGNEGNRKPADYDTHLFSGRQRKKGGNSQYSDDEFDDDEELDGRVARVKCEATVRKPKRVRYRN
ncbi:IVSP4-like protein [Lissonota sp. PSUC_FEM 10030012]|nr:IVSP4-like protein [Lissonota sp. PSUC_FEM 10030012]